MKSLFFLLIALVFINPGSVFSQTDKELAASLITKEKIEAHIYFLASDELKGRGTGTNEKKIAAQYLANTLHSYGVKQVPGADGYFQNIPLTKIKAPTNRAIMINGELPDFAPVPLKGGNINYEGPAVYLNYGLEKDYAGKDVRGKLVFVKAGSETVKSPQEMFQLIEKKKELAQKNGAIAVVELAAINPMIWSFLDRSYTEDRISGNDTEEAEKELNYLWLLDPENKTAASLAKKQSNFASVNITGIEKETFYTRNVVAMVEGTDPLLKDEYLIYSGHYDHVGIGQPDETGDSIYNGARDNAVGVTTVLSMAENLAKHPTKRSALFILFAAEEIGLVGSQYYVDNPLIPLNKMVYLFNSDNAGYNDTSKVTIVGLSRTTAGDDIKVAASAFGLEAIDDPAPEQNLFDRSDNVHFATAGIPSPTFSMGFTSFSGQVTETYHKPNDEADTIDYDYLVKFFKSYVLAGRLIANNPKTPFWVNGDKYEEAGIKLYGN